MRDKIVDIKDVRSPSSPASPEGTQPEKTSSEVVSPPTGLKWGEVLGKPPEERKVRERGIKKEAEVSAEVFKLTRDNLVEAALVYGKGLNEAGAADEEKVGSLKGLANILRQINPELDFSNPQQVEKAVAKLFEQHKGQAVALALAYQELKHQAMTHFYQISLKVISPMEPAKAAAVLPTTNEIVFNPDGTITYQSRIISYEEFIKTPAGQKRREGLWGWLGGKRPVSQEEFQKMLQGESGKEGRYKITISTQVSPSANDSEKFLLYQLGLLDEGSKPLDPNNRENLQYLFEEYQRTGLMRNEIAKATGVSPEERVNVFEGNFLSQILSGITIENTKQRALDAMEEAREEAAKETKQRLEKLTEERIVEVTRAQLQARIQSLQKELEEAKKRDGEKPEEGAEKGEISQEIIKKNILSRLKGAGFQEDLDAILTIANLSETPKAGAEVLDALEVRTAEIEATLAARADDLERLKGLREQISQLRSLQAQKQTVTKGGQVVVIEASGEVGKVIEEINQQIQDEGLGELDKLRRELGEIKSKIAKYKRWLGMEVNINGQKKTVQQWLEEYVALNEKEKQKAGVAGNERKASEIEEDLSEARILLGYFDEENQRERNERVVNFDSLPPVDFGELEALNPALAEVLKVLPDYQERKNIIRILQTIFGIEIILPTARDDQRVIDLVNFLKMHQETLRVSSLEDFKDEIEKITREVLKGKKDAGSQSQATTT